MANDALQYGALGLTSLLGGYLEGRKQARAYDIEQQKLGLLKQDAADKHLKALAEQYGTGLSVDPDTQKVTGYAPDYLDPTSNRFQGDNRKALLDAMSKATAGAHPTMRARDVFALQGKPVPVGADGKPLIDPDLQISSSFVNVVPKPAPTEPQYDIGTIEGLTGTHTGLAPGTKIGKGIAALAKRPAPKTAPEAPSESDLRAYRDVTGLDGAGLTKAQISQRIIEARNQGRLGEQFGQTLDENKKKDLQNRVEKIKQDYEKTGIPSALPLFRSIDEETGFFSGATGSGGKADPTRFPGVGTNTARAIPLIGDSVASLASKRYNGQKVNMALQKLLNTDMRTTSGTAVTKWEQGRNMIAHGMGAFASPNDVQDGLRLMYEGMLEADKTARVGDPDVLRTWQEWGGQPPLDTIFQKKNESDRRVEEAARLKSAAKFGMGPATMAAIDNPKDAKAVAKANQELSVPVIEIKTGRRGRIPREKYDAAIKSGLYRAVK